MTLISGLLHGKNNLLRFCSWIFFLSIFSFQLVKSKNSTQYPQFTSFPECYLPNFTAAENNTCNYVDIIEANKYTHPLKLYYLAHDWFHCTGLFGRKNISPMKKYGFRYSEYFTSCHSLASRPCGNLVVWHLLRTFVSSFLCSSLSLFCFLRDFTFVVQTHVYSLLLLLFSFKTI